MQKENTISVELNFAQIQMLLSCLYETNYRGLIQPEDTKLFAETQEIIESAENFICDLENRINLGI
jgi:hypothetical protein